MRKLLITGGSGLLGSSLAMSARDKFDTLVVYNKHRVDISMCRCEQVDLVDYKRVEYLLDMVKPEYVVHCAALVDVDYCEDNPAIARQHNVLATENMAKAAKKNKAKFVYISTDSVFDGKTGMYGEQDQTNPLSIYAQTKLEGECAVKSILTNYMIVRTSVYGWSLTGIKNFAEWVYNSLKEGNAVNMFTDIFFTPILANDLSDVLIDALSKDLYGIYHIAGSQRCRKLDFAMKMADIFNFDRSCIRPVVSESAKLRAPRSKDPSLDVTKISSALGKRIPDLQSGLERFKSLLDAGYVKEMRSYFAGKEIWKR